MKKVSREILILLDGENHRELLSGDLFWQPGAYAHEKANKQVSHALIAAPVAHGVSVRALERDPHPVFAEEHPADAGLPAAGWQRFEGAEVEVLDRFCEFGKDHELFEFLIGWMLYWFSTVGSGMICTWIPIAANSSRIAAASRFRPFRSSR